MVLYHRSWQISGTWMAVTLVSLSVAFLPSFDLLNTNFLLRVQPSCEHQKPPFVYISFPTLCLHSSPYKWKKWWPLQILLLPLKLFCDAAKMYSCASERSTLAPNTCCSKRENLIKSLFEFDQKHLKKCIWGGLPEAEIQSWTPLK